MKDLPTIDAPATPGAPRLDIDDWVVEGTALGHSQSEIAECLGCSVRSVARRQKEPAIRQQINDRRAEMTAVVGGRLLSLAPRAVDVLAGDLDHDDARVRRSAATAIIDRALKVRRMGELEDRVNAVESQFDPAVLGASPEQIGDHNEA